MSKRHDVNLHIVAKINANFHNQLTEVYQTGLLKTVSKLDFAPLINKYKNINIIIDVIVNNLTNKMKLHLANKSNQLQIKPKQKETTSVFVNSETSVSDYMKNVLQIPDDAVNQVKELYTTVDLEINNILGMTSLNDVRKELNPVSLHKKAYLTLDTKNRRLDVSMTTGRFSWFYSNKHVVEQGVVFTTFEMKKILAIQLYQPVIPLSTTLTNSTTQRVSILIEELEASAYIANASRKYHYLCRFVNSLSAYTPIRHIDLQIEDFNEGLFKFHSPVNLYNSITLSFGDPLNALAFYNDRQTCTVSAYGSPTTITTPVAHNLTSNDLVYITGFATNTPSYDNDLINTPYGQIATVTGATTFTIPVDTSSGSVSWIVSRSVDCFYAAFRAIIPMEITYIDDNQI